MKKYTLLILTFLTLIFGHSYGSPTERYLNKCSLNEIIQSVENHKHLTFDISTYIPMFIEMIAAEDHQFFGYHGSTTSYLVFLETVKAIEQELQKTSIPDNFYYLRNPNDLLYAGMDASEYLHQTKREEFTISQKREALEKLLIIPMNKLLDLRLSTAPILDIQIEEIFDAMVEYEEYLKELCEKVLLPQVSRKQQKNLKREISRWAEDPTDDRYRSPETEDLVQKIFWTYDDSCGDQQKLLLSLNATLFGNFSVPNESTIYIFSKNKSVDFNSEDLTKELEVYCEASGIDLEFVKIVNEKAQELFGKSEGVILQFYANDTFVNKYTFVSETYGAPMNLSVRELLESCPVEVFNKKDIGIVHYSPQLRLVIGSEGCLNPENSLRIRVWDRINPANKDAFRTFLKQEVRKRLNHR